MRLRIIGSSLLDERSWVTEMVSANTPADSPYSLFYSLNRSRVVWERISPVFILRYYERATTMKELMTTPKIDRMEAKSRPMVVMGKYYP